MEILLLIFVIFYNNVNIKNYVVVYIFFMGKFCYGKKVVKIVVKYCVCGICKWWLRYCLNLLVCFYRCEKLLRKCLYVESISGD